METSQAPGEAMPKSDQNPTPPSPPSQDGRPTGPGDAAAATGGAHASQAAAPPTATEDSQQPPPPTGRAVYTSVPVSRRSTPRPEPVDVLYICMLVIMGFCFWEWQVLSTANAGLGTTLFFLIVLGISLMYLHRKGMRQNPRSLVALAVAVAGALPFVLYGARDINILLLFFEIAACLAWVAYTCKTNISARLSGLLTIDLINQMFVVPLANGLKLFSALSGGIKSSRRSHSNLSDEQAGTRRRQHMRTLLAVAIVLIIFIPVLTLIIVLLATSDAQFDIFLTGMLSRLNFFEQLDFNTVIRWVVNLVLGVPVACYIFGQVYGNVHRRYVNSFEKERVEAFYARAHVLPPVAFSVPLFLLITVYVCYFAVMAPYLFSAFTGILPGTFTYAEYARQGFFELCGVAVINMLVLYLTWLLAKRTPHSCPLALRILAGSVTLLTCLLVTTAASKMLLYVQTYGLSPLRLYTSWFMVLLFISFVLILLWHLRPFNVARPLVIVVVTLALILALTNTNGLIARYNTDRYLSGQTTEMDVALLESLGDAALPALYDLESRAVDEQTRREAQQAVSLHIVESAVASSTAHVEGRGARWYDWNITSACPGPTQ